MLGAERRLSPRTRRVADDRRAGLHHRRRAARGLTKLTILDPLLAKLGVAVADRLDVARAHRARARRHISVASVAAIVARLLACRTKRLDVAGVGAADGLDPGWSGEIRARVAAVGALRRLGLRPRAVARSVAPILASGLPFLARFLPVLAGRLAFFARRIAIRRAMGSCERGRCDCARKQQ
jgi:hypothetical protein